MTSAKNAASTFCSNTTTRAASRCGRKLRFSGSAARRAIPRRPKSRGPGSATPKARQRSIDAPEPGGASASANGPPAEPEAESATDPSPFGFADDDPALLADRYLDRQGFRRGEDITLRFWGGDFCIWRDGAYKRQDEDEVRNSVADFIEDEFRWKFEVALVAYRNNRERGSEEKPPTKRRVTRAIVSDVLQLLKAKVRIRRVVSTPCWLTEGPPVDEVISFRNGILHLPTWAKDPVHAFSKPTPQLFTFNRIDFDFEPDAAKPRAWLAFLNELWPDDPDSIAALRQWFGYLITPDTSLQKMLLLIGPTRAGKGTIGKVLKELVGHANLVSPTLGRLAGDFGPQDLLNKPVALVSDARLSGRSDTAAIVEELLSISGEDLRTIPRKYMTSVTTKLPTRFVFLSNEFPALGDASGAIIGRFVVLRLTETFLGREDNELFDRFATELPGILLWALEGWRRVRADRRFIEPESGKTFRDEARAAVSPITVFVEQCCEVKVGEFAETADLYKAWVRWSKEHGREYIESRERFVIRIRSIVPSMKPIRRAGDGRRLHGYEGIRLLSEFEQGSIPD